MAGVLVFFIILGYLYIVLTKRSIKNWLPKELKKWTEAKLITEKQASNILDSYQKKEIYKDKKARYTNLVYLFGSIFIAVGLILFVYSNWQNISPTSRIIYIIIANIFINILAIFFYHIKKARGIGAAIGLVGAVSFGAAIFLVAQVYNISSHYPNALLFWFLLTVPYIYIFKEKIFIVFSLIISLLWMYFETDFYAYVFADPLKYILFAVFIFCLILYLIGLNTDAKKDDLTLKSIHNTAFIGLSITTTIFRFVYFSDNFLTSGYTLHLYVLIVLAILVSGFLLIRKGIKQNLQIVIFNILFLLFSFSCLVLPGMWNSWLFILISESFAIYQFYSISEDEYEKKPYQLWGLWLIYAVSTAFLAAQYEQGIYVAIALIFVSAWTYYRGLKLKLNRYLYISSSIILGLLGVFMLTLKDIFGSTNVFTWADVGQFTLSMIVPTVVVMAFSLKESLISKFDFYIGSIWDIIIILQILSFVFLTNKGYLDANYLIWNIIYVVLIFISLYIGFLKDRLYVINVSLGMFSFWIIYRYFDYFWEAIDKSLFFIGGGIILILLGFLFSKRKFLTERK